MFSFISSIVINQLLYKSPAYLWSIYWKQELLHSNISVQDSDSASVTRNLWQMLIDAARGEKVTALARLLGDDKSRQLFHAKLVFPIHVQKQLESGEPLLHQMFHMVSINLQTEISRFSTPGTELITVLNMLTATEASAVKSDLHAFFHAISM